MPLLVPFNIVPCVSTGGRVVVLVKSTARQKRLAFSPIYTHAILATNQSPPSSCPRSCFILPSARKMLREEGWPKSFIKKVPLYLSVFSTGHNRLFRLPLVVAKKISFAVVQRLGKGMPAVSGAETWAFKNTMLAVQVRLYCCLRNGWSPVSSKTSCLGLSWSPSRCVQRLRRKRKCCFCPCKLGGSLER